MSGGETPMVSRTQEFLKISKEDDGPPVGAQAQQCTVNELARKMVDEYYPTPRGKGGVWEPAHDAPEGDTREHSSKKLQV